MTTAALSLALLTSGLSLICEYHLKIEQENARLSAQKILDWTEQLLDKANIAARNNLFSQHAICDNKKQFERLIPLMLPSHIHAVGLADGDTVWCSSDVESKIKPFPFALTFMDKHGLSKKNLIVETSMLYYANYIENNTFLVNISTSFITNRFNLNGMPGNMYVQIGAVKVWNDGSIGFFADEVDNQAMRLQSANFPISVTWQSPQLVSLSQFITDNILLTISVLLATTLCSYLYLHMLDQLTSPSRKLKRAIAKRQLQPFYQPFFDSTSGRIAGFEVLARWKHPRYGYISPDIFIPIAEQHHLMRSLTRLLMQKIVADLHSAMHLFPESIYICINISAQNCLDSHLKNDITEMSINLGGKCNIVVEVTERHPLEMTPELDEWLTALRHANISVALDDFGTGYSNLAYISELAPEFIKIDKMFINQIDNNADTRLVDSIIQLARKMRLKVIAEGVETREQMNYLCNQNVDFMQGYFFCHALSGEELIERMRRNMNAS